jgi:hypothetical protein
VTCAGVTCALSVVVGAFVTQLFSPFGRIDHIIHSRSLRSVKRKDFAFVYFVEHDAVEASIKGMVCVCGRGAGGGGYGGCGGCGGRGGRGALILRRHAVLVQAATASLCPVARCRCKWLVPWRRHGRVGEWAPHQCVAAAGA